MILRTNTSVGSIDIHIHPNYTGASDTTGDTSSYNIAVVELEPTMDSSPWKISQTKHGFDNVTLYAWGHIGVPTTPPDTYPTELRSALDVYRTIDQWSQCGGWKNASGGICIMNESGSAKGLNCDSDTGGPAVANGYVVGLALDENNSCGKQTAGLLAALSGSKQEEFLQTYANKCGFTFGKP